MDQRHRCRAAKLAAKIVKPEPRSGSIKEATFVERVVDTQVPGISPQAARPRFDHRIYDAASAAAEVGAIVRRYESELFQRVWIRQPCQRQIVFVVVVVSSFYVEGDR